MVVITFAVNHIGQIIDVNITKFSVTRRIVTFWAPLIDAFLPMIIGFIIFGPLLYKPYPRQLFRCHISIGGASA